MFDVFEKNESEVRSYCRKYPVIFDKGLNSELYSVDGRRYIDFLAVAGSMNYGHNNPEIKDKILTYLQDDHVINMMDMYTSAKEEFLSTFSSKILEPRGLNYKVMCCGPTGTNALKLLLNWLERTQSERRYWHSGGGFTE